MNLHFVAPSTPVQLFNCLSSSDKALIRGANEATLQHLAHNGFAGHVFGDASILVETQKIIEDEYQTVRTTGIFSRAAWTRPTE